MDVKHSDILDRQPGWGSTGSAPPWVPGIKEATQNDRQEKLSESNSTARKRGDVEETVLFLTDFYESLRIVCVNISDYIL